VVDSNGELTGILYSDQLLEYLVSEKAEDRKRLIKDIAQPPDKKIDINTPMYKVMQLMDSIDMRILPVTDADNIYKGFVTKNGIFNKYRHILSRQGTDMI
jgi:CIC family chloride channel protein